MHALEFDHAPSLSPTTRKQWHIKGHRRTRNFATLPRRNRIEIMFGRLKDWRRVATRYDRCPETFFSAIMLAATVLFWL
ncbi:transposase [Paracoccus kondratievae]|nr:transposase [Paracoccus kondratievae]